MYERSNVYDRATTSWKRRRRELYTVSLVFLFFIIHLKGEEKYEQISTPYKAVL